MRDVMNRIKIRPADKKDAAVLAEVCKKAFESDIEFGAPGKGGPPGYDLPEAQIRLMKVLDYFAVLLDDKIVGGIIIDSGGKDHKVLERIFVDPEYHRRGIGTRASELLFDSYPNTRFWTLGTPEWNVRTNHFYENLGFVQVGWDLGHPDWRGRWYQRVVDPSNPFEMVKVGELKEGMKKVTVEGEILEKPAARTVRSRKRGETLTVVNAILGDETGKVVLVLWNRQIDWVDVGSRIRVENGYVSSYSGVTQLNVGRIGRLIVLI